MKKGYYDLYFLVWRNGPSKPYATTICSRYRQSCIDLAEKNLGQPWEKIYKKGGRVERIAVIPQGDHVVGPPAIGAHQKLPKGSRYLPY